MPTPQNRSAANALARIFWQSLVSLNRLDAIGFNRFLFAPGMLFDQPHTWWPGGRGRPTTHEGLDVCFFEATGGRLCRLDETTRIPMAFDGELIGMCKDFLGKTIIARHFFPDSAAPPLYGLYAHILPESGRNVGDHLTAGQALGHIAPVKPGKSPLPPHLHLTFARADRLPPVEELSWPVLNRLDRGAFYDPLRVLEMPLRILPDASEAVDFDQYAACQTLGGVNREHKF